MHIYIYMPIYIYTCVLGLFIPPPNSAAKWRVVSLKRRFLEKGETSGNFGWLDSTSVPLFLPQGAFGDMSTYPEMHPELESLMIVCVFFRFICQESDMNLQRFDSWNFLFSECLVIFVRPRKFRVGILRKQALSIFFVYHMTCNYRNVSSFHVTIFTTKKADFDAGEICLFDAQNHAPIWHYQFEPSQPQGQANSTTITRCIVIYQVSL